MDIKQIRFYYEIDQLSAREIGEKLGYSVWQVIKFMKKNDIKRREARVTKKYIFERQPLSFTIKTMLTDSESRLLLAGLMLYWAEGAKAEKTTVDLANCDPKMIFLFLRVLRNIYRVDEKRLRVLLYCFDTQRYQVLLDFWSEFLHIPKSQFIKPYIKHTTDKSKSNKMPYGVAHIRYNDKKLFACIEKDTAIITDGLLKLGW